MVLAETAALVEVLVECPMQPNKPCSHNGKSSLNSR
jgi:hypothetical protein